MDMPLLHKRVAILAADGFEQSELEQPMRALEGAGAHVSIVSPNPDSIFGMNHSEQGDYFDVDVLLDQASPDDFDALMLPGGLMNPDSLRMMPKAVNFVRGFAAEALTTVLAWRTHEASRAPPSISQCRRAR